MGSWVVALDNLSSLPRWLSDGLCRLSTGGGYAARQLYTDADEVVIDVQRPTILTGITDIVTAPDLLDRALLVELESMPDSARKTERELLESWIAAWPRIFGALLDAVVCALRRRDEIHLTCLPRLADWVVVGTAAEPALGFKDGKVLCALTVTRGEAIGVAIEASPIVAPLLSLTETREWIGTASELLRDLECTANWANVVPDDGVTPTLQPRSPSSRRDWPGTARALAAALARLALVLGEIGIVVERLGRGHGGIRRYRVARVKTGSGT